MVWDGRYKAALNVGGVEVIAISDVDSDHLSKSAEELEKLQGSKPKSFKYFGDLLDMKGIGCSLYRHYSSLACPAIHSCLREGSRYLL